MLPSAFVLSTFEEPGADGLREPSGAASSVSVAVTPAESSGSGRQGEGGDIAQTVRSPDTGNGDTAGLILYECKDTLRWSKGSLDQIRQDRAAYRTP